MHLKISNNFSQQEGVARVKKMLVDAKPELAGKAEISQERWEDNILHFAFEAQGQKISGQLEVQDKAFVLDAKLPFMLRMFEGKIETMITEQAGKMLG